MLYKRIGHINLPVLGIGTYPVKGKTLYDYIELSYKNGYRLIDTAYKYQNEEVIGKALDEIDVTDCIIQTKYSEKQYIGSEECNYEDKESVKEVITSTCKRLNRDNIDVCLLHGTYSGYLESYRELMSLYNNGCLNAIGICGAEISTLEQMKDELGVYPLINQIEVHPYYNNKDLIEFCKQNNIMVEARSPLAHGDAIFAKEPILKELALKYGKSIPQIILRWLLQQDIIVITKCVNKEHNKQNIDIFNFELSNEDMCKIFSLNKNISYGFISKNQSLISKVKKILNKIKRKVRL
ncbi:MAG: aldo/keto reductase [Paludibacteraceae bacterium]|nr:aldo/keto reductase [Paludibacteraceae bacterium]